MSNFSRKEKIKAILEARRPMAQKVEKTDKILNQIENNLRSFREFIPRYAEITDPNIADNINALVPEADNLISQIAAEKSKLALLAERFSRQTLNIGVAGLARQGKSTLLQSLTGLSSEEIPSGAKGHCTGAPSIMINHDSDKTYAEITYYREDEFFEEVILPFYAKPGDSNYPNYLGEPPSNMDQFANKELPNEIPHNSEGKATNAEHLKKLRVFKDHLHEYRNLLTGAMEQKPQAEIRSYVAQHSEDGLPFYKWIAVKIARIKCQFPQSDIGCVALADTPGLGDFLMGAEEQLVATVGKSLDIIAFVRRPPVDGAIVLPADTQLYDLISRSIPDLNLKDWSYFIINRDDNNEDSLDYYESELEQTKIKTRKIISANCLNKADSESCLNEILNDVADNLEMLDERLFDCQQKAIKTIASNVKEFAKQSEVALPKAEFKAPPDEERFLKLFNDQWDKLAYELDKLVSNYYEIRTQSDPEFIEALQKIFDKLKEGPGLPTAEDIERQSASKGLQVWHGNKLHELRVRISNSFESLDECLELTFKKLREQTIHSFTSEDGGNLKTLQSGSNLDILKTLSQLWGEYETGKDFSHGFDLLIAASLSFRGFIQPRVRECLDILDSSSAASELYSYTAGDKIEAVKENLDRAWDEACYKSKVAIEQMAKEPAMARFAAVEDFRETIIRTGGEDIAKQRWQMFYGTVRADVWPEEFKQLADDTRQRKEWEKAVQSLRDAVDDLK